MRPLAHHVQEGRPVEGGPEDTQQTMQRDQGCKAGQHAREPKAADVREWAGCPVSLQPRHAEQGDSHEGDQPADDPEYFPIKGYTAPHGRWWR